MTTLGIVIPAFRADTKQLVEYIEELQTSIKPDQIRVELDDPRSADIPAEIIDTGATVNVSDKRRGKGAAVTAGFEALDTDILVFLDADGSTPITSVASIIHPVRDGSADISAGSRRHPASTVTDHQTVARRYLGDAFAYAAQRTLSVEMQDYQCGAKAITAESWSQVRTHLYEEGFAWDLELLSIAGALDLSVIEIPIMWEDKPGSTVDPIDAVFEMGRALIAVRHRSQAIRGSPVHSVLPQSRSRALLGDD